jgi:eukaryotic-like serine/threonine-protein kinase
MKQILFIAFTFFVAFSSCKKTISVDTPLPLERKESLLIPTNNRKLYCIDPVTGIKRWEFTCSGNMLSSPAVYNDVAYLGTSNGIYAIDMFTGKQKWYKYFNNIEHPITIDNELLYFATKSNGDSFYCYNLNANRIWAYRDVGMAGTNVAPTIAKGCVYFATSNGRVYCMDKVTGQKAVYNSLNYFTNPVTIGTNILGAPQFEKNKIYVPTDSKVVCLNDSLKRTTPIVTGTPQIWSYNVGGLVTSSPLVYGDMCVVGGEERNIHCIDAQSGSSTFRWKYLTGERVRGGAAVDKKRENMIVGGNDFNLYSINFVTGDLRWKFPSGSMIQNSPIVYKDNIYFTSFDKNLYCLDGENGKVIWKYNLNNACEASPMIYAKDNTCTYPCESGNSAN